MTEDRHTCLFSNGLCQSGTVEGDVKTPAKTEAPDSLCPPCERLVARSVDELPEMWLRLHTSVGDKAIRRSDKVSGTRVLPVPLNLDVDALKLSIVEWLTAAAAVVAVQLNTADPSPANATDREHGEVVGKCVRLLTPHLDKLLGAPADCVTVWRRERVWDKDNLEFWQKDTPAQEDMSGIDIAAKLVRTHKLARSLLGQTNPRYRLSLPCSGCEAPTLFRKIDRQPDGDVMDTVSCDSCGRVTPYKHYEFLATVFVDEEKKRLAEEEAEVNAELERRATAAEQRAAELEAKLSKVRLLTVTPVDEFDVGTLVLFIKDALGEAA